MGIEGAGSSPVLDDAVGQNADYAALTKEGGRWGLKYGRRRRAHSGLGCPRQAPATTGAHPLAMTAPPNHQPAARMRYAAPTTPCA